MKGSRLSDEWMPDADQMAWARLRRPDLDIGVQIELFKNYWLDKTGKDATKITWRRTFANWIIRAYAPPLVNASPTKRHLTPEQTAQKTESIRREKVIGMPQQFSEILSSLNLGRTAK